MYSTKLYTINNTRLLYCLHHYGIVNDTENRKTVVKPEFFYGNELFSIAKLTEFLLLLRNRLAKNFGFKESFSPPVIRTIFFGSYNAILWSDKSSSNDQFLTIYTNDIISGYKFEYLSDMICNSTFKVIPKYVEHIDELYSKFRDRINKNTNSIIFLESSDIHYLAWLSENDYINTSYFKKHLFLKYGKYMLNPDGWNASKFMYYIIDSPIVRNKSFTKPKLLAFSNEEEFEMDYYVNYLYNKKIKTSPDYVSAFGAQTYSDHDNGRHITLGDHELNNRTRGDMYLGFQKPMLLDDLSFNAVKKLDEHTNWGKTLLDLVLDINYFTYAQLILRSGQYLNYENKVIEGGKDVEINCNVDQLNLIYKECKEKDILLPVIFSNANNDMTVYSMVNLFTYILKDAVACSDSNLNYRDSDIMCEPYYRGLWSLGIDYSDYIREKDCSQELNAYAQDYRNYASRFLTLYNDLVSPIIEFGYNKVEEFAALLLNFLIDNEIDNYFEWSMYLMDNKIRDIVSVMNAIIKFKERFGINESHYIALEYLVGLTLGMVRDGSTIKDLTLSITNVELEDFRRFILTNSSEFSTFETNFILVLSNIYLTDMLKKNYLEV